MRAHAARFVSLAFLGAALFAAPAHAQWSDDEPFVLRGRVVTMDGDGPIEPGQVVVRDGRIAAVLAADAAVPDRALIVETDGFIYPGLMNLHNHMKYNFLGLYDLPEHAENSDDWPGGSAYERGVNDPATIVTKWEAFDRIEEVDVALLEAAVGSFGNGSITVHLELRDETLHLRVPGQGQWALEPAGDARFDAVGLPGYGLELVIEQDGSVPAVRLLQPNGTFRVERVGS